ncbi:hypothetical protein OKC48_16210 [Methylorubrum extorquens]|uniref:hypothetical protein n=1 Tax=Methylorubrum extorquens TaxID=408 RepID=UPI002237C51C|nr:hypothetical protein [Methylorubrum extorquens]UYW24817.1 hypothetical protein OKC48_16210 [Methylorubrum extorquens]
MKDIAEKMRKLAAAIAAIAAMVAAVVKAIFGGSWGELKHDVKRHAAAAREMTGFAGDAAAAVGRGAGHVLSGPLRVLDFTAGAIGQTLGAMLPTRPVTAKNVADAAVERDETRIQHVDPENNPAQAALVASNLVGIKIQSAASSLQRRGGELHDIYRDDMTPPVAHWLESLTSAQLQAVVDAPSYALDRHINAKSRADLLPGLPRVLSSIARLARAVAEADVGPAAMEEMMAKARANMRGDRAGVAEMMKRGPRPPQEPETDEPTYSPQGPRPSPRPSFH